MNSTFLGILAITMAAPFLFMYDLVFRLLFPLPIVGTIVQLIAIIYLVIGIMI
jgi:hypothetical protein